MRSMNSRVRPPGFKFFSYTTVPVHFKMLSKNTTSCLAYKQQKFLTALEAGSQRLGCQNGQMRALFFVADTFLYPHKVEGARELNATSPIRAFIPLMLASLLLPNHLPKSPLTNITFEG